MVLEIMIAVVVLGLLGVAVALVVHERRRTDALEMAAHDMGMAFEAKPSAVPGEGFRLMTGGRQRRVRNLIRGTIEDLDVRLFDYAYTTGSGKNSRTHRQSVVLLRMPRGGVPEFILTRETVFDRLGSALGYDDIDFDDDPEFSRRFKLKSDRETRAREVFDTELRRFMLTIDRSVSLEAKGSEVIVYRRSRRTRPAEIMPRLTEAFEIATRVWSSSPDASLSA